MMLDDKTACAPDPARCIFALTGADRHAFLQGLITQDIKRAARDGILYAALLTPQGKLITDFFVVEQPDVLLVDAPATAADDLERRLTLFKLRAAVQISRADMPVTRGIGPAPKGAVADPRDPSLGWRLYGQAITQGDPVDWDALRIAARVPEFGAELIAGDSFILELGFERLNGVDFRKGCYVGQEVTARMRHKTELRRGLFCVALEGPVPVGSAVIMQDGREAGAVYTQAQGRGLALLRKDRIDGPLSAAGVAVSVTEMP